MGRSKVTPVQQPDDTTCGPAALKHALDILGKRKSLSTLIELCQPTRNGTSTKKLVTAANKLGVWALVVKKATLKHLQSSLRNRTNTTRAAIVSFLYEDDDHQRPQPDSGHWAAVRSFSASRSRIVIMDSSTAGTKSYNWSEFRKRWKDYDYKRRTVNNGESFKLAKTWQNQLLVVLAKNRQELPKFSIASQKLYSPAC